MRFARADTQEKKGQGRKKMNSNNPKVAAVAAYITWIGFIIAIIIGDRSDRFVMTHINQALVINIVGIVGGVLAVIPLVGGIIGYLVSLVTFVFAIMGICRAAVGSSDPLPIIGDIHLIG